ncbi:MAG: helix-turn-helix domain-containing protein [Pseudomonadota bacterium]
MMAEDADRIRALDRGLSVIELLARNGHMSLADLRQGTDLPNPTLLRILATLQARGWVRRNIVEGRYELSHSLGPILGENARGHPLAELAEPHLLDLARKQSDWPSDLCAVLGPGTIEIIESTRQRGPMAPTRTGLGLRPSMVFSAHGRATLAFSTPDVVDIHLNAIRRSGDRDDRSWIETGRLQSELNATRSRGFAVREPNYWAPPFDPGPELGAMAVPIRAGGEVHGTISILWIVAEASLDAVLDHGCLDHLRAAADSIGAALSRRELAAPLSASTLRQ